MSNETRVALSREKTEDAPHKDVVLHFEGFRLRFTAGSFSQLASGTAHAVKAELEAVSYE